MAKLMSDLDLRIRQLQGQTMPDLGNSSEARIMPMLEEYGRDVVSGRRFNKTMKDFSGRMNEVTKLMGEQPLSQIDQNEQFSTIMPNILDVTGMGAMAKAYHGTPHKFDKFKMKHIGKGEGAQAYGHGLYFAENPKVAGQYQRNLALGNEVIIDGKQVDAPRLATDILTDAQSKGLGIEDAKRQINEAAKSGLFDSNDIKQSADFIDSINGNNFIARESRGSIYEVDIPDEHIKNFLDWDAPLSEQPESVKKAIDKGFEKFRGKLSKKSLPWKAVETVDGDGNTAWKLGNSEGHTLGRLHKSKSDANKYLTELSSTKEGNLPAGEFYRSMAFDVDNGGNPVGQEELSEYLNSLGIKGIKYYDGSSRAAGKGTRNLVIFDDSIINMKSRNGKKIMPDMGKTKVDAIDRNGIIEISKIETPKDLRGKGLAEKRLNEILMQADKEGKKVALTPSGDFGANKNKLIKWYKKHGFVANKGRNKDFMTKESMIREPIK